jgi:hypothetical protein
MVTGGGSNRDVSAQETKAGQILNKKECFIQFASNAVGFFGGSGRGADRDIVSIGLLDGDTGELGAMLMDHFLKLGKCLDFIQPGCIGARKF